MNYIMSFLFSGLVCFLAQIIYDNSKLTPGHITSLFVVLGSFLDLFHIYDRLIEIFHAGALIPITSFGHSLMPVSYTHLDVYKRQRLWGTCSNGFV